MSALRNLPQENLERIGRAMRAMDMHFAVVATQRRDEAEWKASQRRYQKELTRLCSGLGADALLSMLRVVEAGLSAFEDMNWGDAPGSIDDAKGYLASIAHERALQEEDAA
jgi:hypothetical protein